jgi:signal peptidase I
MDAEELVSRDPQPVVPPPSRLRSSLWELGKILSLVLVLVFTIRTFVVEAYVINGKSMEPTFHDSERLLIEKFAPRFEKLERGDVIIFTHPEDPSKRLIKRVIGLPGETIEIRDGVVSIDGIELDESKWLKDESRDGSYYPARRIEDNCYFVLGDNRDISNDSRRIGTIPRDLIIGKYLFTFYPLTAVKSN